MQTRCRVFLAEDHKVVRDRVRELLEPTYEVVGTANNGRALVDMAKELNPEVLVVDIAMPELNGIDAVWQIVQAGSKAKIVFLTVYDDPDIVRACFDVGAQAFVLKGRLASDLFPAIHMAMSGHTYVSPTLNW